MRTSIALALVVLTFAPAVGLADSWMCTPTVEWDFSGPDAPFKVGPDHPMFPSPFVVREISPGKFTKQSCKDGRCDGEASELVGGFMSHYKNMLSFRTKTSLMTTHPNGSYSIAAGTGHWVQLEIGKCVHVADAPPSGSS